MHDMANDPVFNDFLKFTLPFWLPIATIYMASVLIYEIVREDRFNRRLAESEMERIAWA